MYLACSYELEDQELIKLAVSVLREVSFTAVGLQTSVPIIMQVVFGLVSAYRHAAVWDARCLQAGCVKVGKCLQAGYTELVGMHLIHGPVFNRH